MRGKYLLGLIAIVLSIILPARATLLAYDGFSYTSGTNLNALNGGSGSWTGAWSGASNFTIGSASLSFGSLATSGRQALAGSSGGDSFPGRSFSSLSSGTFYVSALMSIDASTNGFFGFRLGGGSTIVYNGTAPGQNFLIRTSSGSPLQTSSVTPAINTTYLLVMRVDFNTSGVNDTFSMFINPTPGAAEPGVAAAQISEFDAGSISTFQFYQSGNISTAHYDEVRIGTTWADVTPVAVPEPGAIGAVMAGALAGLCFVRRKLARR